MPDEKLVNDNDIRHAMRAVAQVLEALEIRYAVVGSVAALSHGYGRSTIDIDVLAEMKEPHVEEFASRLDDGSYYVDAPMIRDAIRHASSFNLYHFETGIKIDIFISRAPLRPRSPLSPRGRVDARQCHADLLCAKCRGSGAVQAAVVPPGKWRLRSPVERHPRYPAECSNTLWTSTTSTTGRASLTSRICWKKP